MTGNEIFTVEMTRDEAVDLLNVLSGADDTDDAAYERFYEILADFVDGKVEDAV